MLGTLRAIVQEVNRAPNLGAVLAIIVNRVRMAVETDVCSVYLLDRERHRFVLRATEGLRKSAVGRVEVAPGEGIVGEVAVRAEPVNLEKASTHPSFRFFEQIGEEPFNAFLGAPILQHGEVIGVLTIQQKAERQFGENEEAFLVTLAAQLAGVIQSASDRPGVQGRRQKSMEVAGSQASPGVGIGAAFVISDANDLDMVPSRQADNIEEELALFSTALFAVRGNLSRLEKKFEGKLLSQELAIFHVYQQMLADNALGGEIQACIRDGEWAQGAVSQVMLNHVAAFERMEDPYLRERAADVRDLGRRLLQFLQSDGAPEDSVPKGAIVVGAEISPGLLGDLPPGHLAGLVSTQGSSNAHIAILARSMSVPMVVGVNLPLSQFVGRKLIVDGDRGMIIVGPSARLVRTYRAAVAEVEAANRFLGQLGKAPCKTKDGERIELLVNTAVLSDIRRADEVGAEGVGLFRTEVSFMISQRFPSENEQVQHYRQQLVAFHPRPVTMRTLDIGGDKALPYFPITEANPYLGWRGIRVTLDHPEIFMVQVRAMLRASEGLNNLRILLPMVTSVDECRRARGLIDRVFNELVDAGFNVRMPAIGVMVEVPAMALQLRDFLPQVEFLSVGSNDLIQYLLAVDRNNARVRQVYNECHPAFLRLLAELVRQCREVGRPLGICGELAGRAPMAVLLVGMGFRQLSMHANALPRIKWVFSHLDLAEIERLTAQVLAYEDADRIESELRHFFDHKQLIRFFR